MTLLALLLIGAPLGAQTVAPSAAPVGAFIIAPEVDALAHRLLTGKFDEPAQMVGDLESLETLSLYPGMPSEVNSAYRLILQGVALEPARWPIQFKESLSPKMSVRLARVSERVQRAAKCEAAIADKIADLTRVGERGVAPAELPSPAYAGLQLVPKGRIGNIETLSAEEIKQLGAEPKFNNNGASRSDQIDVGGGNGGILVYWSGLNERLAAWLFLKDANGKYSRIASADELAELKRSISPIARERARLDEKARRVDEHLTMLIQEDPIARVKLAHLLESPNKDLGRPIMRFERGPGEVAPYSFAHYTPGYAHEIVFSRRVADVPRELLATTAGHEAQHAYDAVARVKDIDGLQSRRIEMDIIPSEYRAHKAQVILFQAALRRAKRDGVKLGKELSGITRAYFNNLRLKSWFDKLGLLEWYVRWTYRKKIRAWNKLKAADYELRADVAPNLKTPRR